MRPIYVGDVVTSILRALKAPSTRRIYFISGGTSVSYEAFIDAILVSLNLRRLKIHIPYGPTFLGVAAISTLWRGFPLTLDALRGLEHHVVFNSSDAERDLGIVPTDLRQGLEQTFLAEGYR